MNQGLLASQLYESLLERSTLPVTLTNALAEEQREFIQAIRTQEPLQVSGETGREAVAVADRILKQIEQHQWNGTPAGPVGPHAVPVTPILQPTAWTESSPGRKAA